MSYILTTKTNDEIVIISDKFEVVSNGILLHNSNGDVVFCPQLMDTLNVNNVDIVPEYVIQNKYCYSITSGFAINPNYVEYKSPEQKIEDLQVENTTLKSTVTTMQSDLMTMQDAINMVLGL